MFDSHVHVHIYIHISILTLIFVLISTCQYHDLPPMCTYSCTCMHAPTHTRTHAHTQTPVFVLCAQVFSCTKDDFAAMPAWKRDLIKKKKNLF